MRNKVADLLLALALVFAIALGPAAVVAQESPPPQSTASAGNVVYDDYFMSDEHRQQIYDQNRKRSGKALLYTAILPGLGNIYAEQYLLAGLGIVLMVFAGTFVAYGITTKQSSIAVVGAVTAGVAYGGGAATSLVGVAAFNRKLRQGLKIEEAAVREVWTPTLVLRF